MNNYQWNSKEKLVGKLARILEVSKVIMLANQVEALSQKIDNLSTQKPAKIMTCDMCWGGHTSTNSPTVRMAHRPTEQVDLIGSKLRS